MNKKIKLIRLFRILLIIFSLSFVTFISACDANIPIIMDENKEFVVSFDSNGGSEVKSITVKSGSKITEPVCTKENYEFVAWTFNGKEWNFENDTVTSDITLVANWYAETYSVVFNKNGGSGSTEDGEFIYGVEYTIPEFNITRNGYKFNGWNYNDKIYKSGDKITFYAKQSVELKAEFVRLYTITFDSNDGSGKIVVQEGVEANSSVTLLKNSFKRDKCVLFGWSLEKNGEMLFADCEVINYDYDRDITLYAIWLENVMPVDYSSEVIEKIDSIGEVTYGSVEIVNEARSAYNKLSSTDKAKVTNYEKLVSAEIEIAKIFINVLETNDNYSEIDVTTARSLFDSVVVDKRDLVTNYDALVIAEFWINNRDKYNNADNDIQSVLVSLAYKYYYQAIQIQYEQYNSRRNIDVAPNTATSERIVYLDCSSYANSIIYNGIGSNITSKGRSTASYDAYASENSNNVDVIYHINTADYPTLESQQALLSTIYASLKPGDLVNYRHGESSGTKGHVMFYIGNGKFLHCTGGSKKLTLGTSNPDTFTDTQTSTEKNYGAIGLLNASEIFTNTSSSRYLFRNTSSDKMYSFSVIRVVNREGVKTTDYAKREYLLDGVTFEKKASVGLFNSVRLNDEITYTITIKNSVGKKYNDLYVTEMIPEFTSFVSCTNNGVYNEAKNGIIWKIDELGGNKTCTVSFTVKVDNDKNNVGKNIVSSEGSVCGIKINLCSNPIEYTKDLSKVSEEANKLIGQAYENNLDYVKKVYKNAWGCDIFSDASTTEDILKGVLNYYIITPTSKYYKYLVGDVYGGIKVNTEASTDNRTMKLPKKEYLQAGDIILAYTSYGKKNNCYIYLDSSTMLTSNNGTVTKITSTETEMDSLITTFAAYDRFVVMRPSLVHE